MAFTDLKKRLILKRMGQLQKDPACPRCGANEWTVNGPIDLPFVGDRRHTLPVAAVVCDTCGYVDLVSTSILGVE